MNILTNVMPTENAPTARPYKLTVSDVVSVISIFIALTTAITFVSNVAVRMDRLEQNALRNGNVPTQVEQMDRRLARIEIRLDMVLEQRQGAKLQ